MNHNYPYDHEPEQTEWSAYLQVAAVLLVPVVIGFILGVIAVKMGWL